MTSWLDLVRSHLPLRLALGLVVALALGGTARLRYRQLVARPGIDFGGVAVYQRSGFWLAATAAWTAIFVPAHLATIGTACALVLAATSVAVGTLQKGRVR